MMHMLKVLSVDRIGTACGLSNRELLTAAITNAEAQVTCEACVKAMAAQKMPNRRDVLEIRPYGARSA